MKLVMMLYTGSTPQRVADVLDSHDANAFTEIGRVHGRGLTGRVEGTRAWPGESSVLFSVVPDERVAKLEGALRWGEIEVNLSHVGMLLPLFEAAQAEGPGWTRDFVQCLHDIQKESAIYLMVRKVA